MVPTGLTSHKLLGWLGSSNSSSSSADAASQQSSDSSSSRSSSDASVGMEAYLPKSDRSQSHWEGSLGSSEKAGGSTGVLEAVAAGDVQDNGDGTYSCSYAHTVAGSYYLHVTNGKRP